MSVRFLVYIISEHPLKAISLISETETVGTCLFWKLKWRKERGDGKWGIEVWPPALPSSSGYAPVMRYALKGISKSLKYTWSSLIYQF